MYTFIRRGRRYGLLPALLVPCMASTFAGASGKDGGLQDPKEAARSLSRWSATTPMS